MKVYQVLIHFTEYGHGYKDDESWTKNGPAYHARVLAERAKERLNKTLPNNDDLFGFATVREIEVLDHFDESQLNFDL